MKTPKVLREEAKEKREVADLLQRVGPGLAADERALFIRHATTLLAEAKVLEAAADVMEKRRPA